MANIAQLDVNYCLGCAKCCVTHPCALEPEDLGTIANYLNLPEDELFARFLVLDYVESEGGKQYYVCPARKGDVTGTVVDRNWTFSDSPCIFLHNGRCSIQQVKPKGGRTYYCSLLTNTGHVAVGYGKKASANDWSGSPGLRRLLTVTVEKKQHG